MSNPRVGQFGRTVWAEIEELPPPELSPNGRSQHWAKRQKAKRYWHEQGRIAGHLMRQYRLDLGRTGQIDKARVTYSFTQPTRRRRDIDNLIYMMKPFMDGLVESGLLVDDASDHVRYGDHEIGWDPGETRTTVYVRNGFGTLRGD